MITIFCKSKGIRSLLHASGPGPACDMHWLQPVTRVDGGRNSAQFRPASFFFVVFFWGQNAASHGHYTWGDAF